MRCHRTHGRTASISIAANRTTAAAHAAGHPAAHLSPAGSSPLLRRLAAVLLLPSPRRDQREGERSRRCRGSLVGDWERLLRRRLPNSLEGRLVGEPPGREGPWGKVGCRYVHGARRYRLRRLANRDCFIPFMRPAAPHMPRESRRNQQACPAPESEELLSRCSSAATGPASAPCCCAAAAECSLPTVLELLPLSPLSSSCCTCGADASRCIACRSRMLALLSRPLRQRQGSGRSPA